MLGQALDDHRATFRQFHCYDGGDDTTRIWFVDTINGADTINYDLGYYFPTVSGFNCPNT